MSIPFELFCLGHPRLLGPDGQEVKLRGRKHLALVIYLAIEGTVWHRREHLIDLLWPDVDLAHGRQSLATALSLFRSRLGDGVVERHRESVRMAAGRLTVDVDRLEGGRVLADELHPALEVDAFLQGFEVPDAPGFQHWRDRQRARLLPLIKRGLTVLIDHARRTADLRALSRHADRLLAIDDLSEEGVRASMEASALAGDRLTALRRYDDWAARLASEVGASPGGLVEGMATRLRRRGWERPVSSTAPVVRTEQWRDRPFVGRRAEYRVLYETWEEVMRGHPRHLLLYGESGVGKTTLADRLGTAVGLEGASVSRVRCFQLERGIPFAAIGSALAHLLDRPGATATQPSALADLGRIIPEVRARYADLPTPPELQGESARIRFAEAALELLQALMEEHPVVLVVDDLHLADEASLSVLHLLMRRIANRPFCVVMTCRPQLPERATHAALIRDSAERLGVRQLEIEPMAPGDAAELLEAFLGSAPRLPSASERRALLAAAAGYPMLLELLVKDWEAHGADALALSLTAMTAEAGAPLEQMYRRLAEGMSRALDPTTRMVLHVAALLDRRLNEFGMYGLMDVSVAQTMAGLSELVHRRVLRDVGTGLEFSSPMVRAFAYRSIPGPLRRALHDHVATRLVERHRAGEFLPGLELAWHLVRAGRTGEAAPHLLRGAREAINGGAPHEAELALRSGMGILSGDNDELGRLLLVEALQEGAQWNESLEVLDELAATTDANGIQATLFRVIAYRHLGRIDEFNVRQYVDQLAAMAHTEAGLLAPGLTAIASAHVAGMLWQPDIQALFRECIDRLLPSTHTAEDRARVVAAQAMLAYQAGDTSRSLDCLRQAIAILSEQAITNSLLGSLHIGAGANLCSHGEYEAAMADLHAALNIGHRLGSDLILSSALANLALAELRLGSYREAVEHAAQGLRYPSVPVEIVLQASYCQAFALAVTGIHVEAEKTLDHIRADRRPVLPWIRQRKELYVADILKLLGRGGDAKRIAAQAIGRKASTPLHGRHAGIYVRWKTAIAHSPGAMKEALAVSEHCLTAFALDRFDLAEVLSSSLNLRRQLSLETGDHATQLRAVLASLPPSAAKQMALLGCGT